ncbi:MAG: archease [Armatimonadota bacterium]
MTCTPRDDRNRVLEPLSAGDIVLCDFDGTITYEDTGIAVINAIDDPRGWEFEMKWRRGEIDSRECLREQWALMDWGPERFARFLSEIELDASFKDLWELVRERNARLLILSDGLDLYLDPMMARLGFEVCDGERVMDDDFGSCVPRFVNHAYFRDNRVTIEFPHSSDDCDQCGNCKLAHLRRLRPHFRRIIYVGDGYSDQCVARYVDVVFAKSHLAEILDREGLRYWPFEHLADVAALLDDDCPPSYKILDHTADYAIRAWGRNLGELIANAAAGMISLMIEREGVVPTETREIEAEAESSAVLVHHCLRELLHLAEDGLMPLSVTATACEDPPRAKLTAQVVPVGKIRDRLLSEVKAVTYHNLELRREGDWLVMDLVFDT